MTQPEGSRVDVREHGANQQTSTRRLYMQLQAFGDCDDPKRLAGALERARLEGVLYADAADPLGVAVLGIAEDPAFFVGRWREILGAEPFLGLRRKPELAMFGRTYSSGFETDLEDWLLARPRRTALGPEWPWAIWYPLRRTGTFARLTPQEQGAILREHAALGRTYGEADLAHDVRLACHGLDTHDNDFVIGLVGPELHPLSHLVQTMRRTAQTSEFIQTLGPFFVGHALWRGASG
jgi:chlorite dismutase